MTVNGTIELFIVRLTVRVVLYVVADLVRTLRISPFWKTALVHTSILLRRSPPVLIVPVTVCPVANHAMMIGLDIYTVFNSAPVLVLNGTIDRLAMVVLLFIVNVIIFVVLLPALSYVVICAVYVPFASVLIFILLFCVVLL